MSSGHSIKRTASGRVWLSPLLSNIMLDQLDKYLEKRGCRFIRYADDFSIYTKSKSEAKSIGNEVYLFLRDRLSLQINRTKSGIRRPSNFTVLGHSFTSVYKKGSKGQYQLIVSKGSWANLKRKLKRVTKKTLGYSFYDRLISLKLIYQGWINNYRLASIYTKLKKVDEWMRNRLRYCIWHDYKRTILKGECPVDIEERAPLADVKKVFQNVRISSD
jgi:RNA-directed DNA polymerase